MVGTVVEVGLHRAAETMATKKPKKSRVTLVVQFPKQTF